MRYSLFIAEEGGLLLIKMSSRLYKPCMLPDTNSFWREISKIPWRASCECFCESDPIAWLGGQRRVINFHVFQKRVVLAMATLGFNLRKKITESQTVNNSFFF